MSEKYINSKMEFYTPEIIILALYIILYCIASSINKDFLYGGLLLGILSFIFFVIEHKTELILDKVNNSIVVRTKMLFFNKYMIKEHFALSDISSADILTITTYDSKTKRNQNTYKLRITKKDGSSFTPFGNWSDNNYEKYKKMADKINHIDDMQEPLTTLSKNSFFFRLCFGIPLGFLYFLLGFGIIFPKEMEPIIYNTLNILFSLKGYHQ